MDKTKLFSEILKMLEEDLPQCGHDEIALLKILNAHGYFWHCSRCASEAVVETLFNDELVEDMKVRKH